MLPYMKTMPLQRPQFTLAGSATRYKHLRRGVLYDTDVNIDTEEGGICFRLLQSSVPWYWAQ